MSRLVMLSDATGVRGYAGVLPARMLAQMHQSGYGACKDVVERANIAETRHLAALWRITSTLGLVAKDDEQCRERRGNIAGVAARRSGRRGEPRSAQGLRASREAGRPEPYSVGGAARADYPGKASRRVAETRSRAGGVGVQ
jgi:hypothetical protein